MKLRGSVAPPLVPRTHVPTPSSAVVAHYEQGSNPEAVPAAPCPQRPVGVLQLVALRLAGDAHHKRPLAGHKLPRTRRPLAGRGSSLSVGCPFGRVSRAAQATSAVAAAKTSESEASRAAGGVVTGRRARAAANQVRAV